MPAQQFLIVNVGDSRQPYRRFLELLADQSQQNE